MTPDDALAILTAAHWGEPRRTAWGSPLVLDAGDVLDDAGLGHLVDEIIKRRDEEDERAVWADQSMAFWQGNHAAGIHYGYQEPAATKWTKVHANGNGHPAHHKDKRKRKRDAA